MMKIILSPDQAGHHENRDRDNCQETAEHADPRDLTDTAENGLSGTIYQQWK